MSKRTIRKRRRFSREILGLIGISAAFSLIVFLVLTNIAVTIAEVYCFENDVPMTEFDWMKVDSWIFGLGGCLSICLFCFLFLSLLSERLVYIRKITGAIDAMRLGEVNDPVPLEGNNELTELADAINYMSSARQEIAQKERILSQEKEHLIRSLSHDIRTPLTSILAYSEYLSTEDSISVEEQKKHLNMMKKKAEQIRDLTEVLLDGSKRNLEYFEDVRLLMEQLASEFEEALEEQYNVCTTFSLTQCFSGTFDVQELRRIFDNLSSNVQKYADPAKPVILSINIEQNSLVINQRNAALTAVQHIDSYHLGLRSIRRIAQNYGGAVTILRDENNFEISIMLSANL